MNLLLFIYIKTFFGNSLIKEFHAISDYLLVEIFSDDWLNMKIEIVDNQVIMSEISQESTQYLQLYYKLQIGQYYKLDILTQPDNNVTISEVPIKTCPNNCSNNGNCQNLKCFCSFMSLGDRCQFQILELYNRTLFTESLKSQQTIIVAVYFQQSQLLDDYDQTRDLQIQSSSSLDSKIYLLQPFEYPQSNIVEDKLIYMGLLSSTPIEIDYSNKFEKYRIQNSYYCFILILKNINTQTQDIILQYQLLDNNQKLQDFILIAILCVISFIILLIIIYIARRRCHFSQQTNINKNKNKENQSSSNIIQFMPIVNPVKNENCIICLDPLDNSECRQTPCKHIIHHNCLKQWFEKQQICPICRDTLNDIEHVPKNFKSRNQTSHTFILNNQIQSIVQSDRNSVRSEILT